MSWITLSFALPFISLFFCFALTPPPTPLGHGSPLPELFSTAHAIHIFQIHFSYVDSLAIFELKWATFDLKWNLWFTKIIVSEWQQKTEPVLVLSSTSLSFWLDLRSSNIKIVREWLFLTLNGPLLTKTDIQDFCKYFYMNGSKKLCQYLWYHPLLCLFDGTRCLQKLKYSENGYFWPKMNHFWPKMKSVIYKIFVSEWQQKTVPVLVLSSSSPSFLLYLRSSNMKIVRKWLFWP